MSGRTFSQILSDEENATTSVKMIERKKEKKSNSTQYKNANLNRPMYYTWQRPRTETRHVEKQR